MLSTTRIISFTDGSESARKVNAVYDNVKEFLFDDHNWNFARRQKELSQLSESPLMDWTYKYQLPGDCVRVLRMLNDEKFARYGDELFTDADSAIIEYITNDETMYSPSFVMAFAANLALVLSYGVTQSSTQTQLIERSATDLLKRAKWNDAQEGVGLPAQHGSFIDERGG